MNVLEVAVYAMVLTAQHPKPFDCYAVAPRGVNCTNGLSALPGEGEDILFSTGVAVLKDAKGQVRLSDGTTAGFDAMAWVTFRDRGDTPIVSVRKIGATRFKFSNGIHCETPKGEPERARCWRP